MANSRPCRVCRKWFHPDRKVGDRQHVCGDSACQQEWHRRNCIKWHRKHPGRKQEAQLEEGLVQTEPAKQRRLRDPLDAIDWGRAKAAVGLKIVVLMRETGKVILRRARDLSSA